MSSNDWFHLCGGIFLGLLACWFLLLLVRMLLKDLDKAYSKPLGELTPLTPDDLAGRAGSFLSGRFAIEDIGSADSVVTHGNIGRAMAEYNQLFIAHELVDQVVTGSPDAENCIMLACRSADDIFSLSSASSKLASPDKIVIALADNRILTLFSANYQALSTATPKEIGFNPQFL